MNAKVEPLETPTRVAPESRDTLVREGVLAVPGEVALHHGGRTGQ